MMRLNKMRSYLLLPVLLLLALAAKAQELPQLFQVTTAETKPGDAVLIRGEYLNKITGIEVGRLTDENVDSQLPAYMPVPKEDSRLDKGGTDRKLTAPAGVVFQAVRLLQQNTQSVKFIIPSGWKEGVYCVQLRSGNSSAGSFYVNVPRVNWAISEEGLKAVAGDYLRIQGKNLLRAGVAGQAVLLSANGKTTVRVKVEQAFDDYSVRVVIPAGTAPGAYHLYYHNGQGGITAWSEPLAITVVKKAADKWDQKTFNVQDFGAKGDGVHNETGAFRAALDAAEKNGGATVYVPRGRYMLTGELIMPAYTRLKGESKSLVQLFWNPLNWDTNELPNSLISGTHHFEIRDMVLWASRAWGFIMLTGPVNEQGNITLENLIVRQNAELSGKVYQVKALRDIVEAEINSRWTRTGIILRGENLKIRNCEFNSPGMYTFFAASGFIQNCKFERKGTGVNQPYMLVHPKGLIFEDCYKQADGYGYAASIDESYNMYEARNVIPYNYTNDREAMTLDGGSGGYAGPIAAATGDKIILPAKAEKFQWVPDKWIGGGLYIVEGKGAGQYRRIVKHGIDTITLDQPFLVAPDASSVISITTIRKNLFYVNNEVTDGGAYQFYGSAQNCVIAGLRMKRSNGVVGRGSLLYHGKQPNWYIDIVNCSFTEGNYSHWWGIDDRGHSGYQNINLIGAGGSGLNIGTLIRRNQLSDYSYIRTSPGANANGVTDAIIEDNSFRIAKTAIFLGGSATHTSNVLIHHNHYQEVDKRLETKGLPESSYLVLDDGGELTSKAAVQELSVASIFNSGMVLQQGQVNPVWGWAAAYEDVTVVFNGKEVTTKADTTGKWKASLPALPYGGPYRMTIKGSRMIEFDNIMIGEVWLCSGQSNMGVQVLSANNPDAEIAAADYPDIRLFSVSQKIAQFPETDLDNGRWVACSPATVKKFSAVAYYFGRYLYQQLHISIGLIHSSVGGTYAENWMSPGVLETDPDFKEPLAQLLAIPPNTQTFKKNERPGLLYNGMIHPLIPFGIKGVIWYQGEANTGRATQYKRIFPNLIKDWRKQWGGRDFPFLFVSLANYTQPPSQPSESSWAELREAQATALQLPHTGMALAIDLGDANDLHPRNKQDVGKRLALNALNLVYQKPVVYAGPQFAEMKVSGEKVQLKFRQAGSGLRAKDGHTEIRGFAMAGSDRRFYWADATITNDNTVELHCSALKQPVAVRYAWADNPGDLNLYNKEGLPAAPFRTDQWEQPKQPVAGL